MGMTKPVVFPAVNKNTVVKNIRQAAALSENITITRHALERMRERGITRIEVNRCLQHGQLQGAAFKNEHDNWQAELMHTVAGKRLVVQAALITEEQHSVIVVTTWRLA